MYIGEKAGSSLKERHRKIDILPMNWKPPNQKLEMGRNASQYGAEEGTQLITMAKILRNFPACSPSTQRSTHLTLLACKCHHGQMTNYLTVRSVCLLNLSKYFKEL